ncbi:hypothetical protein FRC10_011591 [Ceratobasidium sp. 414]|nr:hypothetical protein FRC10_011591 [Ceratobasidium sp. 414]
MEFEDLGKVDLVSYWNIQKTMPLLRAMSKDVLPAQASSVSSERIFSSSKNTCTRARNKLSVNTVEKLQILKHSLRHPQCIPSAADIDDIDLDYYNKPLVKTLEGHVTLGQADTEGFFENSSSEGEGPRPRSPPTLEFRERSCHYALQGVRLYVIAATHGKRAIDNLRGFKPYIKTERLDGEVAKFERTTLDFADEHSKKTSSTAPSSAASSRRSSLFGFRNELAGFAIPESALEGGAAVGGITEDVRAAWNAEHQVVGAFFLESVA